MKYLLVLLIVWGATGCKLDQEQYIKFRAVPEAWSDSRWMLFSHYPSDTINLYNIDIILRYQDDYPYNEAAIIVDMPTINPQRDTITYRLTNNDGRWNSSGVNMHTIKQGYKNNIRFNSLNAQTISIANALEVDSLWGISDIGIHIYKTTQQ